MEGERDLLPLAICAFDFLLKNKTKKKKHMEKGTGLKVASTQGRVI